MKKLLTSSLFVLLSIFSIAAVAEDMSAKKDGVVLETIMTIDNNEIAAAQLAEKKTSNADVKGFAQSMITDHSKNLQDAKDLGDKIKVSPTSNEKTDRLKKMGQDELKKLDATDSKNFDAVYIDAMVKGHQQALKIIDDKLMPKASNQDLIAFLKSTREVVAHHLQMAQDVQKKIK